VPDFRINIGNGRVIISTYDSSQGMAEETMHAIIAAVTAGDIYVEQKSESWSRLPT
jgi:hypothetical protein